MVFVYKLNASLHILSTTAEDLVFRHCIIRLAVYMYVIQYMYTVLFELDYAIL